MLGFCFPSVQNSFKNKLTSSTLKSKKKMNQMLTQLIYLISYNLIEVCTMIRHAIFLSSQTFWAHSTWLRHSDRLATGTGLEALLHPSYTSWNLVREMCKSALKPFLRICGPVNFFVTILVTSVTAVMVWDKLSSFLNQGIH